MKCWFLALYGPPPSPDPGRTTTALSSAFIPTFTAYFSRKEKDEAWYITAVSLNFALLFFSVFAALVFIFAKPLYTLIAPGFSTAQINQTAGLTRVLILAQAFFVLSYFMTGALESLQRFFIPAIAPIFYNLGIILGAIFFANRWGLYAPTIGAVVGAMVHFLIQLPLAVHLGFRPRKALDFLHPGVREIGKLALPRVAELSFLQIGKSAELFLASLVSVAAYTHFTFANSLQLLPLGLFGTSIAKASLPTLSDQAAKGEIDSFKETFSSSFKEIIFLVIPCSVFLAVLRVPIVRLVFGAARFNWESTIQTGYTLSAFCLGIFAQALIYLLARAFYALHDTRTPVKISIYSLLVEIVLGAIFILLLKLPIWSLALAFSLSQILQVLLLFFIIEKRIKAFPLKKLTFSFGKVVLAASLSGLLMFFFLKILDRSVWDKRLSFLSYLGLRLPTNFDRFVIDTHYTLNVILLTGEVGLIGLIAYLLVSWLLGVKEVAIFARVLSRLRDWRLLRSKMSQEKEVISLPEE